MKPAVPERENRLTMLIERYVKKRAGKEFKWAGLYRCSCGNVKVIQNSSVNSGNTRSCGCHYKTHGYTVDPQYRVLYKRLIGMIQRCHNPKNTNYIRYGARGISVCDKWREDKESFIDWAKENGWKPALDIDRIDNSGDYEPINCRFIERQENIQNSRTVKLNEDVIKIIIEAFKHGKSAISLAKSYGVSREAIYNVVKGRTWENII